MYYFNDSISIYTIAFGSLFNNFSVQRIDKTTSPASIKSKNVPFSYAGKMHWYYKKFKNFPDDYNIGAKLPMMTYNLESIDIDNDRQTNKFEKMKFEGDMTRDVREWCQTCVPYVFNFSINIYTKYQSDMNQIIEQILPFYPNSSRDLHIYEIPILGIRRSVKVKLTSVSPEIDVEFEEAGDRVVKYSLNFSLDGYLYQPINKDSIIKQVNTHIYIKSLDGGFSTEQIIVNADGTSYIGEL